MKSIDLWLALFGFLGVCVQEVIHWVDLKQELGPRVKITRSFDYWVITIISAIVFGLATAIISTNLYEGLSAKNSLTIATGFAFPSVIKTLSKVVLKIINPGELNMKKSPVLFEIKNYFKIY